MFAIQRARVFSVSLTLNCLILQIICLKQLPKYIKPCSRSLPTKTFQNCLEENINSVKPYLAGGIPELRIPPQDPYHVERVVTGSEAIRGEFYNVTVMGASNFTITDFNLDLENSVLTMHLKYFYVAVQTDYKIVGKVLLFELNSIGDGWATSDNIDVYLKMQGKFRQEMGKTFLDFNDFNRQEMEIEYNGKTKVQLNNLFRDKELTRMTNKVLNDNIKEILVELLPLLEELVSPNIFMSTTGVFNVFSIDELVLP